MVYYPAGCGRGWRFAHLEVSKSRGLGRVGKKQNVLLCWIGGNDLKAPTASDAGPVLSTLRTVSFDQVELLSSYPAAQVEPYLAWLREQVAVKVNISYETLTSPVHFGDIYQAANSHLTRLQASSTQVSILLSPGTPAMQAVWILLGKTRYSVIFYQSSLEQGVQRIDVPFEIAADMSRLQRPLQMTCALISVPHRT